MGIKETIARYLRHDWMLHFFIGFFVYEISQIWFNGLISFLITLGVAILIEVYDYFTKKQISFVDIFFTILSAIVMIITDKL